MAGEIRPEKNNRQKIEPTDNFWENLKLGCPDATIDENTQFNDILKSSLNFLFLSKRNLFNVILFQCKTFTRQFQMTPVYHQ